MKHNDGKETDIRMKHNDEKETDIRMSAEKSKERSIEKNIEKSKEKGKESYQAWKTASQWRAGDNLCTYPFNSGRGFHTNGETASRYPEDR